MDINPTHDEVSAILRTYEQSLEISPAELLELANFTGITDVNADIGLLAGYLIASVPFLAGGVARGAMAISAPTCLATCWPRMAPPAGPDSTSRMGNRFAVSTDASEPLDMIISSGAVRPMARRPSVSRPR